MQNINPTQHRSRRALFYLGVIGFPLFFGGLISLALAILLTQFPLLGAFNSVGMVLLFIAAFPLIIAGAIGVYRGLTLSRDNELAYQVGETMKSYLDGRYTFIRNLGSRSLGYIDGVLVGPPGVLVFRIVDYHGTWRNERAEWFVKDNRGSMRAAPSNPSRECARDVYALRKFFSKRGITGVPVYGIIVFHGQGVTLQGVAPSVAIAETPRLQQIMQLPGEYLSEAQRISPDQASAVIRALS